MKIDNHKLVEALLSEALEEDKLDQALDIKDNFRADALFAASRILSSLRYGCDMRTSSLLALEDALHHLQNAISKIKS